MSDYKNDEKNSNKTKEDMQPIVELNDINESNKIKECTSQSSSNLNEEDSDFLKVSKSICKIKIDTVNGTKKGTGFLLSFYIEQERFYCLMSNENVIKKEVLNNNNINIYISYDNELKSTIINLSNNKRYKKSFTDIDLEITVIEILNGDDISKDYFLHPESEEKINNELINKSIYIPQNSNGEDSMIVKGSIKEINKNEFAYLATTEQDSSGSPIFLENGIRVIGMNKEGNSYQNEKYGDFIYPAINIIKEDIRKKRNNGKYINEKYIWDDDKYYIGEFQNNLPYGKGTKYYSNGNILYEGDFINGKFEGNGKYICEDGDYYIGEWKNGLSHGKGTYYYSNGKISYEGDWINNKPEGNGKYIFEDDEYYIGQWKNGLKHGKGTMYDSDGKIIYEGDWINDKPEGNGKYICEDGEYYIGQWKNGLRHGKGIEYYSNGTIMYDGDWINDKYYGNGKYIYDNGDYYIGQWKNGLSHGKGIEYYSNGKKKYEGDYINDGYEGNGKYIGENGECYIGQWKNGLKHGKGTIYYSNGKIKYEGDYINDKYEGNGKYIYDNDEYYIGEFKNNLRHGKGIMYHSNGKIIYEGDWVNGKIFRNKN